MFIIPFCCIYIIILLFFLAMAKQQQQFLAQQQQIANMLVLLQANNQGNWLIPQPIVGCYINISILKQN